MKGELEDTLGRLRRHGGTSAIRGGLRGVEKESLRVGPDGHLAHSPHPARIGSALTHPNLTTDYSEALLEFVTDPYAANWETLQALFELHAFVHRRLDEDELLWPASMPCVVNANEEIPLAYYGPSNAGRVRTVYRSGLGYRYGRAMQAIAGTHFNFSAPESFWAPYAAAEAHTGPLQDFRSERLMGLIRNYRRCGWLVVYLFGASPALCKSFKPEGHELLSEFDASTWYAPFATSLRMSDMGYRNKTQARLDISVNSLAEYIEGLSAAVGTADPAYAAIGIERDGEYRQLNANTLQIENEYYTAIRPKPKDRSIRPVAALRRDGVEYVEVRTLDLNPADPVGLNQAQMRFLETLLIYCLLSPSPPIDAAEQRAIDARDLEVARQGRRPDLKLPQPQGHVPLLDAGRELLAGMAPVASVLDADAEGYEAALAAARDALENPDATPSAELLADLARRSVGFFEWGLALARRHREYFLAMPLDESRERHYERLAEQSLAEAEALALAPDVPFDEYLRRHFAGS